MMKRSVLLLVNAIVLTACGGIPPTHYYMLEWNSGEIDPRSTADRAGITIGVEVFRVEPPFDQDRIVYRADPESPEYGFYAYHRWAAPISRMLPRLTADGLAGMKGVAGIGPVLPGGQYDALLAGTVLTLVEVDTVEGHEARVRLRLDLRRSSGEALWGETMEQMVITRTASVEAVVEEMNTALSDLIRQARPHIETVIGARDFEVETR
jgi:uncharacterized lipoprotein YmbA